MSSLTNIYQLFLFLVLAQTSQAKLAKRYTNSTLSVLLPYYDNSTTSVATTTSFATNVITKTTVHVHTLVDTVYVTEFITEPDSFFSTYVGPNPVYPAAGSQQQDNVVDNGSDGLSNSNSNNAVGDNSSPAGGDNSSPAGGDNSSPAGGDNSAPSAGNTSPTSSQQQTSNSGNGSSDSGSSNNDASPAAQNEPTTGNADTSSVGESYSSNKPETGETSSLNPVKNSEYSTTVKTSLATTPVSLSASNGQTTTSTIYSATTSPLTISSGSLITSQSTSSIGPLLTSSIVSSSVSINIDTSSITTGVTVIGVVSSTTSSAGAASTSNCVASNSTSNSTSLQDCGDVANGYTGNLFEMISNTSPSSIFVRSECPVSIPEGVTNNGPIETNKFQANLFLSSQTDSIWTYPYGLFFDKSNMYGWGVSYVSKDEYVFDYSLGYSTKGADVLITPVGVASLLFSASEFSSTSMKVSEITDMSVHVEIYGENEENYIEFPTVLGQGFVTGIYHGDLTANLKSTVGVRSLVQITSSDLTLPTGYTKYRATLFNNAEWLIYVNSDQISFYVSGGSIQASEPSNGLIIQIAVAPSDSTLEAYYDSAAGMYATSASVSGTVVDGKTATYGFTYTNAGNSVSGTGLVFAFPHQVASLNSATSERSTGIRLDSTTKGVMYAFLTNELFMDETLYNNVQFAPWSRQLEDTEVSWTTEQLTLIASVAAEEAQIDLVSAVREVDTYGAGKLLDRYAYLVYVLSEVVKDEDATLAALEVLKEAFAVYTSNTQMYPLMYDTRFGGISTTANNDGNIGLDYGAGYYNDHHFHYGYFVHAAAIIAYIDSKNGNSNWVDTNKDWVNSLIRDVANPSSQDPYFPVSRMFDWFAGHSWAAGLMTSGAGKNEESTSEDYNFAYGMKLWGKMIGDQSMEARGDLMIAVSARAMNSYFLYSNDNTIEPSEIVANKVAGIFYEGKIAYTTFFGTRPEYIHGIQMLPITPISSVIRNPTFVEEEWDAYFNGISYDSISQGWLSILMLNKALYDPETSYSFYSQDNWNNNWLDNGQSRTWGLAFSAALANNINSNTGLAV